MEALGLVDTLTPPVLCEIDNVGGKVVVPALRAAQGCITVCEDTCCSLRVEGWYCRLQARRFVAAPPRHGRCTRP